jgi:hypothetical protein
MQSPSPGSLGGGGEMAQSHRHIILLWKIFWKLPYLDNRFSMSPKNCTIRIHFYYALYLEPKLARDDRQLTYHTIYI